MSNIKITVEMSKEDRLLVEGLMGSITNLVTTIGNMQPPAVQQQIIAEIRKDGVVREPVDVPAPAPAAEPAAVEPVPTEPAPEVKPVSLAEFQKAVTQAVAKGAKQKAAAKEIINKYAASVSAVPEEKRAEVMAELAKI